MSWARVRALAILAAVVMAAGVAVALLGREPGGLAPRPPSERPALLLLTSLPLVFPEQFTLAGGGSPALTALKARYRVLPISATDQAELARGGLLLMAHPQAQTAENLVALDEWVRRGGRVMLLADPLSEWPSKRPLGDPLRPSPMFMDSGLLAHWGLRLTAPEERGPAGRKLGGQDVTTDSPGVLSGGCAISGDGLVAHCAIGEGRATIVADADFLDAERLGEPARHNLDALLGELANLEKR
jgi:hypothetical protein